MWKKNFKLLKKWIEKTSFHTYLNFCLSDSQINFYRLRWEVAPSSTIGCSSAVSWSKYFSSLYLKQVWKKRCKLLALVSYLYFTVETPLFFFFNFSNLNMYGNGSSNIKNSKYQNFGSGTNITFSNSDFHANPFFTGECRPLFLLKLN